MKDAIILAALLSLYLGASTMEPRPQTGTASWYDDGPGLYAAVHSYRFGDPRYELRVCRADDPSVCVTVTVRDHMANRERLVDLSRDAFERLADPSVGVLRVTIAEPGPTLPPTDTAP
jgi:hypothetical protein